MTRTNDSGGGVELTALLVESLAVLLLCVVAAANLGLLGMAMLACLRLI